MDWEETGNLLNLFNAFGERVVMIGTREGAKEGLPQPPPMAISQKGSLGRSHFQTQYEHLWPRLEGCLLVK